MKATPETLIAWADKIDSRLGPISGRDADVLAILLRNAATALAGIRHPTGSEQFASELEKLGIPAPWELCDESAGEILAANKEVACQAFDAACATFDDTRATQAALWIVCAVNTCAGFKAEVPNEGHT